MVSDRLVSENVTAQSNKRGPVAEIIMGIVNAAGADKDAFIKTIYEKFEGYKVLEIKIARDIFGAICPSVFKNIESDQLKKIEFGNFARQIADDPGLFSYGVISVINKKRPTYIGKKKGLVYIIDSLKNSKEVRILRETYGNDFYLFGLNDTVKNRKNNLKIKNHNNKSSKIIDRDYHEEGKYGQNVRDAYPLSDVFLNMGVKDNRDREQAHGWSEYLNAVIDKIIQNVSISNKLSFEEYAMYTAYVSSNRSTDDRSVGAVIAKDQYIIATGVNEYPSFGGWREKIGENKCKEYSKREKEDIKNSVVKYMETKEGSSGFDVELIRETVIETLKQTIDFNPCIHGEMDAIISCARNNNSCKDSTLYVTTFPCHNCAKHIVQAGIEKVVYLEPYPKSRTTKLYGDLFYDETKSRRLDLDEGSSTSPKYKYCEQNRNLIPYLEEEDDTESVIQERDSNKKMVTISPFYGIGPSRFKDFYSKNKITIGNVADHKNKENTTVYDGYDLPVAQVFDRICKDKHLESELENKFQ